MTMRKRLFVYIHYLEIGGAERALLGLLGSMDRDDVDVDLFVGRHSGDFMNMIPAWVNVLPELPAYAALERPIKDIIKDRHFTIAFLRILAKSIHYIYHKSLSAKVRTTDESIYQFIYRTVMPALPSLSQFGEYDLAISFLHPHNIVKDKVRARSKMCWVHTDYSSVHINTRIEQSIWGAYNNIICVSQGVRDAFCKIFPTLRGKLKVAENIVSTSAIRSLSIAFNVSEELGPNPGYVRFLSIGRYSPAKRFDCVPEMCRILLDMGLKFKWYIIGYGNDTSICANIAKYNVEDTLILLGKKPNPYPYIAATDIYVQPSLYEGKSVTVREAQILGKPVVVSAFPTASSQICDGTDGIIVPMDIRGCAEGIFRFANEIDRQMHISNYLKTHDYGSRTEINIIHDLIYDT